MRLFLGIIAAVLTIGLIVFAVTERPVATAPVPRASQVDPEPVEPERSTSSPAPAPKPAPPDRSRHIELPNGSWVPTLNGVVNAPPLHWTRTRPYAEITGIRRNDPWDWYVHADGTFSTTIMAFRKVLGRTDPTTIVLHPGQVITDIVDGDGRKLEKPGK